MKSFTCIVCPNGCELKIDEETLKVEGNRCPRGEEFAKSELTHPMRTITSTVKTIFREVPVLPVRVSADIPKDRIFDVMKEINGVLLKKKVGHGDIIISNVLDLGVDVIATSDRLLKIGEENER